jgi:hypothetical protein
MGNTPDEFSNRSVALVPTHPLFNTYILYFVNYFDSVVLDNPSLSGSVFSQKTLFFREPSGNQDRQTIASLSYKLSEESASEEILNSFSFSRLYSQFSLDL